jgi:hypothetical protein
MNPFAPGMATPPPLLAGRDELLAEFETLLDRAVGGYPIEVPLLLGERGVGKTVLLNAWVRRARERGWAAHRFQAEPDRPLEAKMAAEVPAMVASFRRGKSKRGAGQISAEAELNLGVGRVAVTRTSGEGRAPLTIEDSARALAAAARQSRAGVVVLFDELHDATVEDLRRLGNLFQFVASEELPIVVGGAGLLSLREYAPAVGASTFTERARWVEIHNLSQQDTELAFVEPFRIGGRQVDWDAAAKVFELTHGYPYVLQLLGSAIWDVDVDSHVTVADVDEGWRAAARRLGAGQYAQRWNRLTSLQRLYLGAAALIESETRSPLIETRAIAERLERSSASLDKVRRALIDQDLLSDESARGTVMFALPLYGRYALTRSNDSDTSGQIVDRSDRRSDDPPRNVFER